MTSGIPSPDGRQPRHVLARRGVLVGALALGGVAAARWFNVTGTIDEDSLSVQDAHAAAISGAVTLIDIRRPDEWENSGIGEGAVPIDMRDPQFVNKLLAVEPDVNAPIALICARGVRSRYLAKNLTEAGFTNIIDVPEGMHGSGAGPGWLRAGLPVTRF
ncbi:rhodanese-like domain-containing protein [Sulfitobacter donghicola]|uniref:Rhodanese n=1 Tax=Sulfitobacter donghicola DSW-25 = KCTC 12864 = JCM 14565 TaxID=1300350 RepID=A0A073IHG6_9RHOB|nr:rhodanese-like domain-containing protein [Sulfitobacter donghicola]KEJ89778.1 rhodanese [Sulfitobacter donghicola DSW-25 = KCTC 12864 = JCM 14565]KIN67116.1 Rhodanese related protein [Sulfitobacter donghicola DSW-25 = KCTC 12864 = JCM 14565]